MSNLRKDYLRNGTGIRRMRPVIRIKAGIIKIISEKYTE
jgi:hypothetical protein